MGKFDDPRLRSCRRQSLYRAIRKLQPIGSTILCYLLGSEMNTAGPLSLCMMRDAVKKGGEGGGAET